VNINNETGYFLFGRGRPRGRSVSGKRLERSETVERLEPLERAAALNRG
jgi:hypothetical protein